MDRNRKNAAGGAVASASIVLAESGLQLSGYTNKTLATVLWTLAAACAAFAGWQFLLGLMDGKKITRLKVALADSLNTGTHLLQERLAGAAEYPHWKARQEAWCDEAADRILKGIGKAEHQQFMMLPSVSAADVIGSVSPAHNTERLFIEARLKVLRRIMDKL